MADSGVSLHIVYMVANGELRQRNIPDRKRVFATKTQKGNVIIYLTYSGDTHFSQPDAQPNLHGPDQGQPRTVVERTHRGMRTSAAQRPARQPIIIIIIIILID